MEKADFNLENALKTFAAGENYHAEQLFGPHRVEEGYLFRLGTECANDLACRGF